MDYLQMTSPCGIDCFNCPMYAAQSDEDLRNMIADKMGISSETAQCSGCRNQQGQMPFLGWSESCPQFVCAREKGVDFCYECGEFPCHWLHPSAFMADAVPHNHKLYNLLLIKKMGVEEWAESEAKSVRDTYLHGEYPILQKAGKGMKK